MLGGLLAGAGTLPSALAAGADRPAAPAAQAATALEASGGFMDWGVREGGYVGSHSQAWARSANVQRTASRVVISTMRHCGVPAGTAPGPEKAAHEKPCKSKAKTSYSSGRLELAGQRLRDGHTLSWTAKVPANATPGTRVALWVTNGRYCTSGATDPAEFDVLEWYGRTKTGPDDKSPGRNQTTATTHLVCKQAANGGLRSNAMTEIQGFNRFVAHRWSVTRTGNTITYKIDGKRVGKAHECGGDNRWRKVPCAERLGGLFTFIMQGEVFASGPGGRLLSGPAWDKPFPTQRFVITNFTDRLAAG